MGRSNEKVSKANKMGYQLTLKQLKSWGVKFNKLKLSPIVFLSNEIFKLEVNYTLQTKLPAFPKELQENTSMIRKGLEKVSAFAVSKYLMEDLINTKPLTILKNVASAPLTVTSQIIQAKSKYIKKIG